MRLAEVSGAIQRSGPSERPIWCLRYAKRESLRLLRWIYYSPDVPCLIRKRDKATRFLAPLGRLPARPVGRTRVGWLYTGAAKEPPEDSGRGGVTAATPDSKSGARKGVRVQLPPPVPFLDKVPRRPVG